MRRWQKFSPSSTRTTISHPPSIRSVSTIWACSHGTGTSWHGKSTISIPISPCTHPTHPTPPSPHAFWPFRWQRNCENQPRLATDEEGVALAQHIWLLPTAAKCGIVRRCSNFLRWQSDCRPISSRTIAVRTIGSHFRLRR